MNVLVVLTLTQEQIRNAFRFCPICDYDNSVIEAVRDTIPPTTIPTSRVMLSMCSYDSNDMYGKYYLDCYGTYPNCYVMRIIIDLFGVDVSCGLSE